jgi:hypothetical protein
MHTCPPSTHRGHCRRVGTVLGKCTHDGGVARRTPHGVVQACGTRLHPPQHKPVANKPEAGDQGAREVGRGGEVRVTSEQTQHKTLRYAMGINPSSH